MRALLVGGAAAVVLAGCVGPEALEVTEADPCFQEGRHVTVAGQNGPTGSAPVKRGEFQLSAPSDSKIFARLDPGASQQGGQRPVAVSEPDCGEHCRGGVSLVWRDYTHMLVYDPFCEDGPPFCEGMCELRSSLTEMLLCLPDPLGPPGCPSYYRTILDLAVAQKWVTYDVGCQKQYFAPFHRLGVEDDIFITEQDEFGDHLTGGATKTYIIANNFVANFKRSNMTISGDPWLRLEEGMFVGKPPATGAETRYEFKITARNSHGSDTVTIAVIVSP